MTRFTYHHVFSIMCLIIHARAITICPTVVWSVNATTVAGSSIGLAGSTASLLNYPEDVFVDNRGALYISDSNNYRVQKWLPGATNGSRVAGGSYGTGLNQLGGVNGISVDSNGSVYVVDSGNHRVMKWAPGATAGSIVAGGNGYGNAANQLTSPDGLFLEVATSTLWIADTNNHRIVKWSSPSTGVVVCGSFGSGSSQFNYPSDLFVDVNTSNTLYVADTYNHRIQKWLPGYSNGTTVAGQTGVSGNGFNQLSFPEALIVDTNGNIFISDTGNNRIMRWATGSSYGFPVAGGSTPGPMPNLLYAQQGLNFDASGNLYIADYYNNRVQMFSISCPAATSTSIIATTSFAGTTSPSNLICPTAAWKVNATTVAGSSIGLAGSTTSLLNYPKDVFVDNRGAVYASDSNNYRVQKWLPGATSGSTVAGGSYGTGLNQLVGVNGISVDSNDNIYVVDSGNHRVMKWAPGAVVGSIVAGGNGYGNAANQLASSGGLFLEVGTLALWIADTSNHRIVKWSSPSTGVVVCGSFGLGPNQFNYPNGVFVDTRASNTLYVADTYNHRIQKWTSGYSNGATVAGQTGKYGNALNQLTFPQAVVVDINGNIFIADTGNNRIMRWTAGSTSGSLIAGGSRSGSSPNLLNAPQGLRFDSSGNLYIADYYNSRVQMFSVSCSNVTTTFTPTTINSTRTTSGTNHFNNFYSFFYLLLVCILDGQML